MLWWRMVCEVLVVDSSARRLQGGFHMVQLRRRRFRAVSAILRIQCWWRGVRARSSLQRQRLASLAIQRWYRRCLLRRPLQRLRRAVQIIQWRWKACQARKLAARSEQLRKLVGHTGTAPRRGRRPDAARRSPGQPPGSYLFRGEWARAVLASASERHVGTGEEVGTSRSLALTARQAPTARRVETGGVEAKGDRATEERGRRMTRDAARPQSVGGQAPPQRSPRSAASSDHLSPVHAQPASPQSSFAQGVNTDLLLIELLSLGLLSNTPQAPPWPQEAPGRSDLEAVKSWLASSLPKSEVRAVLRVECGLTKAAYSGVSKSLGPERLLWHGTSWDSVGNIVRQGFNRAYCGRHGTKLGRGVYFTEDATYALRFCGRSAIRAVFLAGVLPGRCCRGEEGLVEPPIADATGARFDSTVDDPARPKVFCVFRDFQAIPLYLAKLA